MGRTKGTYTLTSNIEPKVGAPLDARTIVKLLVDLTANNTFEYPYKGMKVFVEENNKSYTLIGSDPTVSTNWIEDNSGVQSDWDEDDTTELSYIQNKPNLGTAAFKDVPASGDAGFTQVVLGKDTRLTYYDRNRYDASVKCSTNIVEGNIIVGLNGLYHHLNDGTVFDITYPILYAKNNMAAGAANKSNYDSLAIDITITQQMTLTQFLPVYIKGRLSGNMFNPISTTPLTQEMSQDGYHYMLLGLAGTTTNMYLFHDHRIFANNGGSFCEIIGNLGTAAYKDIPLSGNASIYQVVTGNDTRLSDARPASDVSAWAKESTKPTYTASEVGAIATTAKGAVNGVAELDAAGKVPSSQLPSFVDDVIEIADYDHLPITGESGKIYVTIDTNKTYRWTGSGYAEISESLALGETSSTAYRGDRGKTAYDHSQDTGRITTAVSSGLYKFSATAEGHISGTTAVQKSDITALGIPAQDTTYGVVSKTANGLAPQLPNETTTTKYLRQDGSWQVPPDHTYNFGGTTFYSGGSGSAEHNANSIQYNGVYYYTSNGPGTDIGATTADGGLYAEFHSTTWGGQIAQDYRDGDLFVRGKNNGTLQQWKKILCYEDAAGFIYTPVTNFKFEPQQRKIITVKSTSAWDSQVYSRHGYTDNVYVTFKPAQTNMAIMIGLDSNPAQDANYTNIDYCWYIQNNGKVGLYESGSSISSYGTYAVGDEFRIEYSGGKVRYYMNGALKREVARAYNKSTKLYMDSSMHGASSTLYDVDFGQFAYNAATVNGLTLSLVT